MRSTAAAVVTAVLLAALTACSSAQGGTGSGAREHESHTMPDGTVMEGEEHPEEDGDEPSLTASMICGGQVQDDVTRLFGLDREVEPTSTWMNPMFTRTFDLREGPLVLEVHDADNVVEGMAWFRDARRATPKAEPVQGLLNLGLPAFRSDGLVAFVRDGKTLVVDATGLDGDRLGAERDQTRSQIAYAAASSVLACWTAHDAHS